MRVFDRHRIVFVAALVAAASISPRGAAQAPADPSPTQPATPPADTRDLRRADRFGQIAAFLNLAQGTVRLVAIVATDAGASLGVVDSVASLVRENPSKRLRAYVLLRGGTEPESSLRAALLASRATFDPRIVYLWDPTGDVTKPWEPGDAGAVWLYDTSARFSDRPPPPTLLVEAKGAVLNCASLRATSSELVRRVEAKMARSDAGP